MFNIIHCNLPAGVEEVAFITPGYSSGLAVSFSSSTIDIMDAQVQPPQAPQPDFTELAQCFEHAARQISRFSNIPAFNQGDVIITQLQNITQAIGDLGARFDAR